MAYNPRVHHRRSIRLPYWDYAESGAYCVTLCSQGRIQIFGHVIDGQVQLSEFGVIVHQEWLRSSEIRDEVRLDQFVVMPNHFHSIVLLDRTVGATGPSPVPRIANGPTPRSLSSLMAGFKLATTKRINLLRGARPEPIWQRNYYERVLRDEPELARARQYILDNPQKWDEDINNATSTKFRVATP